VSFAPANRTKDCKLLTLYSQTIGASSTAQKPAPATQRLATDCGRRIEVFRRTDPKSHELPTLTPHASLNRQLPSSRKASLLTSHPSTLDWTPAISLVDARAIQSSDLRATRVLRGEAERCEKSERVMDASDISHGGQRSSFLQRRSSSVGFTNPSRRPPIEKPNRQCAAAPESRPRVHNQFPRRADEPLAARIRQAQPAVTAPFGPTSPTRRKLCVDGSGSFRKAEVDGI
jgi:hypothetical protein